MKKKRKIFESLRFNVFSFVYNVFLKFATPLESGEPNKKLTKLIVSFLNCNQSYFCWINHPTMIP